MKTNKTTTSKEKARREPFRGQLECILGACRHAPTSKSCIYWTKVVDSDNPALAQLKLIEKIIRSIK